MSARDTDHALNGARMTATALCQWVRTPQGGLRATWRPALRVAPGGNRVGCKAAGQHAYAVSRSRGGAQPRRIDRWIAGTVAAALYVLIALAGVAIVVRA